MTAPAVETRTPNPPAVTFLSPVSFRNLIVVMLLLAVPTALAMQRPATTVEDLPGETWTLLEQAGGVVSGGTGATEIQVVFDANCPHSALRYLGLKKRHPDLAMRWVPVAYYKPDSSQRAAAILAAKNPSRALDVNFSDYDYDTQHGAYPVQAGRQLGDANEVLEQSWRRWRAAGTPMFIRRTADGRIQRFRGLPSDTKALDAFIEQRSSGAVPSAPSANRQRR